LWGDQRLPRVGVERHDAEDDRQGEPLPSDRLRLDVDGRPGRDHGLDRGLRDAARGLRREASKSTQQTGLARSAEELARADKVLSAHDRKLLGLEPGKSITSLSEANLPASKLLALSNGTLAELGYSVDAKAKHATTLDDADFARLGIHVKELPALSRDAGEVVAARTGGGVSLAIGMARVFSGLPGMGTLLAYTGTRIGRFLFQELLGRVSPELGRSNSKLGGVVASLAIVCGWSYFILTGNISTIWPMFGIANQLLACAALCVGTTIVLREATKKSYALITILPLTFVGTTTITAGIQSVYKLYYPMTQVAATKTTGFVNLIVTSSLLVCIVFVIFGSARRWLSMVTPAAAGAR
jgi:carbon starvation protein